MVNGEMKDNLNISHNKNRNAGKTSVGQVACLVFLVIDCSDCCVF